MRQTISLYPEQNKYYSDVVRAKGTFVFIAGQIGVRADGSWAEGFVEQTECAFENLEKALTAAGAGFEDVVKILVYMADAGHGEQFNEIYARYFKADRPVRTRILTGFLAPEMLVELDVTAVIDG